MFISHKTITGIRIARLKRKIKVSIEKLAQPTFVRVINRELRQTHIAFNKCRKMAGMESVSYHEFIIHHYDHYKTVEKVSNQ